jgi:hypothetical protein
MAAFSGAAFAGPPSELAAMFPSPHTIAQLRMALDMKDDVPSPTPRLAAPPVPPLQGLPALAVAVRQQQQQPATTERIPARPSVGVLLLQRALLPEAR